MRQRTVLPTPPTRALLVAALVSTLALAACGEDEPAASGSTPETVPAGTASPGTPTTTPMAVLAGEAFPA
jgi:ABC-type glycerol-3-phosphate transport system substrate-binding protein